MRNATLIGLTLILLGLTDACSSVRTSTAPEPDGLNLTATWTGPITIDGNEARMTWNLTQVNLAVTGPVTVLLPTGTVLMNGFLTGSLSGRALPYTISVGNGGVPSRPTCAGQLTGTMTVTIGVTSTLSGPMGASSSNCTPPVASSTVTLNRQ